jgi:hypothetical protein
MKTMKSIEELKHARYLRLHENEEQFPLDGSEWARLVALRLHEQHHPKCVCSDCDDFWVRLHSIGGPLGHERLAIQRSLHYWFLQGAEHYGYQFTPEETSQEKAWRTLAILSSNPESLAEAERSWLAAKQQTFDTKLQKQEGNGEKYWVTGGGSEMWESRPLPRDVRQRALARDLDPDSEQPVEELVTVEQSSRD